MRSVLPLAALAALLGGCGERDARPAELAADGDDARRLLAAFGEEDVEGVLEEVERFVADDRPVLAAEIVGERVLPAIDRQVAAIDAVAIETAAGRASKTRLEDALRARRSALALYRDALSRGIVEDEQLLSAIHAQRLADEMLAEVHQTLLASARER